jgi:hypothetical protein
MQTNVDLGASARIRQIVILVVFALVGATAGGCSSINEKMSGTVADTLPTWAGGLPRDVPPRRGTPEYDAYMRDQERKRLEPAPANANAAAPGSQPATGSSSSRAGGSSSLSPVH